MKAGIIALAGSIVGGAAALEKRDYDYGYWGSSSVSAVKSSSSSAYAYSVKPSSSASSSISYPVRPLKPSSSVSSSTSASKSFSRPAHPIHNACYATTVTVTVYPGETLPAKPVFSKPLSKSIPLAPVKPVTSSASYVTPASPVPTPMVTVCPTPGAYVFEATTVTVNRTITVIEKRPATFTPGVNFYGGFTTSVPAPITITVPYVQIATKDNVVTSLLTETVFVCPSAGVYTPVAPTTTTVVTSTVYVFPYATTYVPGVYTAPKHTVTATVVNEVIVCPLETAYPSTPAAPITPAKPVFSAPAAPVYSAPAKPVYSAPAAPVYSAPAASSSAPAKPSASAVSGGKITTNGNKWAITYTPYTSTGSCKTSAEVDADIQTIKSKGFTTVRLYATDCSGLQNVGGSAVKYGLKLILGVFIKADGINGARPQIAEIAAWGKGGNFGSVVMIVIGNEAIFNGYCGAAELSYFILEAKASFSAAGFTGPVTTTEPLNILQANAGTLCSAIDVIGANIQPFFNSGVSAYSAGDFVVSQLKLVAALCPGKEAYNLESGWPSAGQANGAAQPGKSQQAAAIGDILAKAGERTVIFSFQDDLWKGSGSYGVESSFGCADAF